MSKCASVLVGVDYANVQCVQVLLKFLSKADIRVETVLDGVQCTEKVFSKPHGYYSIILVSFSCCEWLCFWSLGIDVF